MTNHRILDQTRTVPLPLSRRACAGLLTCGLRLICAMCVLQLEPASAMQQDRPAAETAPPTSGPQKPEKKSPANTHATSPDRNKAKNGSRVRLVPINRVQPEYPALAKKLGANGIVEMVATVGKDGHVIAVQVLRGHPLFKQAAKDAVMQWIYPPQTSVVITNAEVNFRD